AAGVRAAGATEPPSAQVADPSTGGAWSLAAPVTVFGEPAPTRPKPPAMGSPLAAASPMVDGDGLLAARGMGTRSDKPKKPKEPKAPTEPGASKESKAAIPDTLAPARHHMGFPRVLSGERARLMLQSLTVPGWGEASLGDRR